MTSVVCRLKWLGGLSCICGLALLTSGVQVHADGLIRDGVGPISTGRGGTNIAFSDNGAVMLDNPAGIANFEGGHFAELGIDTIITDLRYTDPDNDVNSSTQPLPIPEIAYYYTSEDKSWAAGIGVFAPAGFSASYMMNNPTFGPGRHRYRSMGFYAKILPGFAVHVTDKLSIGAAFGVGVSRVELDGPFYMQDGPLRGVPANFDLSGLGAAPIWNMGLQYEFNEDTTVGLAYNSDANFGVKGELHATVLGLGPPIKSDFNARTAITWPQSLGLGIKHRVAEQHRVAADVIWYGWSSAFDDLGLTLTNASNPMVTALLGPKISQSVPLNWMDTVSIRLGYEFLATDSDTWRLGYVYHAAPVPANTLNPYLDGVLEHAATVGYSHRWGDWLLNLAYQYSWSPTREVTDSILAGGDFDNSSFKAQAHWISVSIARYF
jgi:long-subunit fatty acid transport protein